MLGGDIVMAKVLKLLIIKLTLLIIVGCNNNEPEGLNDSNASEDLTTGEDESDFEDEGEDEESSDASEDESTSEGSEDDYDLLSLGETGLMETAIGDFEVTPTSYRFEEELEEGNDLITPSNEVFIIVDLEIKNVDENPIKSEDLIYSVVLGNLDGAGLGAYVNYDAIDNFQGEITPGETMTGEVLFDFIREDTYQLSFGESYLDSLSNEVRWEFYADEAE